ncbi:efflux transporter outer membrane subunit [Parasphingorhabdus sp. JC815]|uniref:efflux transporter outer membrane subunit n=1 Tax=Parasphingorhabdus sp. JC815 TaxID=3232140 RepID=UPI00345A321E
MKRFILIAMTAALSGCTSLAPDHNRPELSSAAVYDPAFRPDGSVIASQLSWRDYFKDPQLKVLLAEAVENNRDLMAATARIAQAQAQYRIQDSQRLPAIIASGGATRSRTPIGTNGTGGGTSGPNSVTLNRYNVGVAVSSFELDFWGRVANLSEAARAEYLATVSAQRAFYLSLIGDVASTYLEVVETQEQIALSEATAESRKEGLRIAKIRSDAGVTSALDFRQAEVLLTQAEQALAGQKLTLAQAQNRLTVLVGGKLPSDLSQSDMAENKIFAGDLDAGLPSNLLLVRPDIVAAEERLRAARANIGAARAAFFPSISLTGSTGFASNDLGDLFSGGSFTWSFGPSINLPIFDGGARNAQLKLSKARESEAIANYDKVIQTAFREVSDALAGRRWIGEQVETARREVMAQERIAHIAGLRYREGVSSYLEVLDAERSLFSAQQRLLQILRIKNQNNVSLFVALGGGFE